MSRADMQKMVYNRTPYVRNPNIIARTKLGGQFGKSVSDGLGLQSPESLTAEEEKSRTDQKVLACSTSSTLHASALTLHVCLHTIDVTPPSQPLTPTTFQHVFKKEVMTHDFSHRARNLKRAGSCSHDNSHTLLADRGYVTE